MRLKAAVTANDQTFGGEQVARMPGNAWILSVLSVRHHLLERPIRDACSGAGGAYGKPSAMGPFLSTSRDRSVFSSFIRMLLPLPPQPNGRSVSTVILGSGSKRTSLHWALTLWGFLRLKFRKQRLTWGNSIQNWGGSCCLTSSSPMLRPTFVRNSTMTAEQSLSVHCPRRDWPNYRIGNWWPECLLGSTIYKVSRPITITRH